jgi:hypothetical protein
MVDKEYLQHVGVVGMRWGTRRSAGNTTVRGKPVPRTTTIRGKPVSEMTTIRGKPVSKQHIQSSLKKVQNLKMNELTPGEKYWNSLSTGQKAVAATMAVLGTMKLIDIFLGTSYPIAKRVLG